MKLFCAVFVLFFSFVSSLFAEQASEHKEVSKLNIFTNVDFVSSHIWRGGKSGTGPSVEPLVEFSKGNVTFGSWAAATIEGSYKELDLYLIYSIKDFSITAYNYYCPPKNLSESQFTDFNKATTYHSYSIDIAFNGTKKLPIKFLASVMLYGNDFNTETGDYYFSTYLEAQYSKSWKANVFSATVGMTTHEGIYYNKAAFVNTELAYKRNFDLKYFKLPVFAKAIYNPAAQKAFFVGGFSISREF